MQRKWHISGMKEKERAIAGATYIPYVYIFVREYSKFPPYRGTCEPAGVSAT